MARATRTPPAVRALIAATLVACLTVIVLGGGYVVYVMASRGVPPFPKERYLYEAKDARKFGS